MQIRNGSLQLFRLFGITVFVHWSWALVGFVLLAQRSALPVQEYSNPSLWNLLDFLALFGIVLVHEFGHSLACRSVGGQADTIMLWPLGGIAFVSPPMRPGAMLWSVFAGPLVNIVLLPITLALAYWFREARPGTDIAEFMLNLARVNAVLLAFNIIPVYPLDGGQILQSILWFFLGYVRSLRIVSVIGFIGAIALAYVFYRLKFGPMSFVITLFIGMQAVTGYMRAQQIARGAGRSPTIAPAEEVEPRRRNDHDDQYRPPQF
jgi:Zn-dependent protease